MFKGSRGPSIDALSLVDLKITVDPFDQSAPRVEAKCCYINSNEGLTYGYIDLMHNEGAGLSALSETTLKALEYFIQCLEEDQGAIIFGGGGAVGSTKAETDEGPKVGLGGTS